MKGQLIEFVEGLDIECEKKKKKEIKDDFRIFGQNSRIKLLSVPAVSYYK